MDGSDGRGRGRGRGELVVEGEGAEARRGWMERGGYSGHWIGDVPDGHLQSSEGTFVGTGSGVG